MCDPVTFTVASLALVGAGTAMQMQGAAKAQRAINEANMAELLRQRGFRDESFGLFDKSLNYNQGETQQGREKEAANDLNAQFQQAADNVFSGASPVGSSPNSGVSDAPKAIGDVYKKSMDEARGSIQNMLTAKAALGGFNRMLGNTSIQNQNITNAQTPIGGFMRGSAGVLPLELQAASHVGDKSKNMGSILSALGTVAGLGATAAAAGAGAGAGGALSMGAQSTARAVPGSIAAANGASTSSGGLGSLFGFLGGGSSGWGAAQSAALRGQ